MRWIFATVLLIAIFFVGCKKEVPPAPVVNSTPAPKSSPPSNPPAYKTPATPYTAIQYGSNLIVSGAGFIVQYNGTSWSSLAPVSPGSVIALIIYNGNLIVGGRFDSIGGIKANNIAQWNGTSWSALGNGIRGSQINAVTINNTNLVAGGSFDSAGGTQAKNIAEWNGTSWSALGTGVSAVPINCLAAYNGNIFTGGSSTIAEWNGVSWDSIGTQNGLGALGIYNGNLIVAGVFEADPYVSYSDIVQQWNGSTWTTLFTTSQNTLTVNAIGFYNGNVVVAAQSPESYHISEYATVYMGNASLSVSIGGFGSGSFFNYTNTYVIYGITTYNGNLIVVGSLNDSYTVASFNGSAWTQL